MSKSEEIEAFNRYHNGCKRAELQILHSNLRFVISVAKSFYRGNPCLELNDLIQTGNIGLIVAMRRFDIESGFKFISYAVWWIRQHILETIKEDSNAIRLPNNARNIQGLQDKFIQDFYSKNQYNPSYHEIAEALATTQENIELVNKSAYSKSLDEPIGNFEDYATYKDLVPSDASENNISFREDVINSIKEVLDILKPKEKFVIKKLYQLDDPNKSIGLLTLAHEMGLTREGVRQLRNRALEKLRNYSLSNDMEVLQFRV